MTLRDPAILEHTLTPGQRHTLARISRDLKDHYGGQLLGVAVIGSCARGDAVADSDVDVLVRLDIPEAMETQQTSRVGRSWIA